MNYFRDHLSKESAEIHPFSVDELRNIIHYRFLAALLDEFTVVPSLEEITSIIFGILKSTAPGPHGFPAEFFWKAWTVVGPDTVAIVQEFFSSCRMLRRFNATTITLIPKITGANRLQHVSLLYDLQGGC